MKTYASYFEFYQEYLDACECYGIAPDLTGIYSEWVKYQNEVKS